MRQKILIIIIVLLLTSVVGAGTFLFMYPYSPTDVPKVDTTDSTQTGMQKVIDANNRFTFDLYSKLNKENNQKNIFYSPYSISSALAMTYEGARGKTKEEMQKVFYFGEPEFLRKNFAGVYTSINSNNKDYQLRTGNALWAQYDYPFLENYTNIIEKYYGGKVSNLDFKNKAEESRETINNFIEEQTNNKIKDLIPSGVLNEYTKLVLTNAIYFKGNWEYEFDKSDTRDYDFKINKDNIIKTQMMYMRPDEVDFSYANLEKLQILELPYKGDDISMLILLPKQGKNYDFKSDKMVESNYNLEDIDLSYENLKDYKSQMKETSLDTIMFPKFEFETKTFFKDTLSAMGMSIAFDKKNADFSGMNGSKGLYINNVIHQAYIKVDEKGTEAAAATAVVMDNIESVAMPSDRFIADHPFVFIIEQKETGNILFMGKVVSPNIKK